MVRHTGEDFIHVECIVVASVLTLQPASIQRTEFDAPKKDGFTAYDDTPLSE
jgi:hypothetical protein